MWRAPLGSQRLFASHCWRIAGEFCCAVVHCRTGGTLIMWHAPFGGHRTHLPAVAGHLPVGSAVLLCTAGLGAHSLCGSRSSGTIAPIRQPLLVNCWCVLLCCCALQDWGHTRHVTCSPQDHRPHWPAMAGQLLGNGIWKDLRSRRVPDLTVARRPGLRLNTESSAPISAKSSYGRKTWRCRRATSRRCLQNSPPCIGFIKMLRVCDSKFISHSAMHVAQPNHSDMRQLIGHLHWLQSRFLGFLGGGV